MTLEQSKGERAALVKGSQGDWAIVKARWDEFRRGIPPLKPGMIQILTEILIGQAKLRLNERVQYFHRSRSCGGILNLSFRSQIKRDRNSPLICLLECNTSCRNFSGGKGLPGYAGHLVVTVMNLKDFSKQELTIMDRYVFLN